VNRRFSTDFCINQTLTTYSMSQDSSTIKPDDFTFEALNGNSGQDSLAYLVGLVDSPENKASDPRTASHEILYRLYDMEEQQYIRSPADLLARQCSIIPAGYFPQTPVMVTRKWSPISAVLQAKVFPVVLNKKRNGPFYVATGVWEQSVFNGFRPREKGTPVEELFWFIMAQVAERALRRHLYISIIAHAGWDYDAAIGRLAKWDDKQIAEADRILWKRTPEG
jgi:hypothetical protein